jgi:TolB-like protein/tetratricopeptide (TPR) repeat protein
LPELEALAKALSGRYRIERELGHGGFAIVYLAHDLRHDRPVALKVLHDEVAASLGAERFEREIKLAARLQHPHIVGVFDSGEINGRLWLAMPFIEGESLRDRLNRERQLPIADAIGIAREVADALDYAHHHDVLHRDIKPENILLTGRHAMVADFGIARALGAVDAQSGLTGTGMSLGSPGYMSPEQATAERQLDARTDVYALGCVLYEMLAGEPPFTGPNAQAVIARMLTESVRPIHGVRPGVSEALDAVLAKALARVPADRYATIAAFSEALGAATTTGVTEGAPAYKVPAGQPAHRWRTPIFGVFTLGVLIGLGGLFAWRRQHVDPGSQTLAVLPFESAGSTDDAYFADGITDEVRGKLAAVPGLRVTARGSANQYRATKKTPGEIGGELGVAYILTGTVRWAVGADGKKTVRVTPELIRVADNSTKWQQPFDNVMSDVFGTQSTIATQVAEALDVQMGAGVKEKLAAQPTKNLEAYDEYLRGEKITEALGNRDPKALEAGLAHYERAVALDSAFSDAWVRVAMVQGAMYGDHPSAMRDSAMLGAIKRVQALSPSSTNAHRVMAAYQRNIKKEFRAAYDELAAALKADANNADLLTAAAQSETQLGMFDSALVHVQRARRIDPKSVATIRQYASTLGYLGRYAESVVEWDRLLAISPANLDAVQGKVRIQVMMGNMPEAQKTIATALTHVDSTTIAIRFAYYQEMMWVLDPPLLRKIVAAKPTDFYKDAGMGSLKIGRTLLLLGDTAHGRVWGDSALHYIAPAANQFPDDAQLTEIRGRANALAGHRAEAIADAERSLALRETSLDATSGPYYRFQVARILLQAGEKERALDVFEKLLGVPATDVTPSTLRLDPNFAPLRGNPRFERLVAKK